MTRFKGFETKEAAVKHQKEHGGMLCYSGQPNANGRKCSVNKQDYEFAVHCGGLDREKYPYCLQWGNV